MENLVEFQNLSVEEQVAEFGSMFNLKLNKKDFKEIKDYNLYTLLTDTEIQNNIQSDKIKSLIKKIRNVAEIFSYTKLKKTERISSPNQVFDFLKTILKKSNENLVAIFLNANNVVIDFQIISEGTAVKSAMYPSKIAKLALLKNSRAVIIAHNHPAGTLKPSQNDIIAVESVTKSLKTIEVTLLDSLIITNDNYYSFKDNGLI